MLRMIILLGCSVVLIISLAVPSVLAFNKVLSLDGDGDYAITPNLQEYFADETVTIEVWFNANSAGVIVAEVDESRIWHDSQIEILGTGEVKVRVWNLTSISLGTVLFGTWHHAVLRYNKTNLVLDGFLDGLKSSANVIDDREAPWEYGYDLKYTFGDKESTNLGSGAYFNGFIDEVRIWNIARTQEQIQGAMNRPLNADEINSGNLVGYWNFDDGTANDLSQYGNDGQLKGDATIGEIIYVSTEGDDLTGDGTRDNPYRTIQKGIDETRRNDIVQALPGTYEENISLLSDLIVLGSGAENTTIMSDSGSIVTANNVHNVSLSGFTIDGQGTADNGILCSGTTSEMEIREKIITSAISCIQCSDAVEVSIEDNTIYQSIRNGAYCAGSSVVKINNNSINNNSSEYGEHGNYGIVCEGQTNTSITENSLCQNWRAIHCCGEDAAIVIEENDIQANDYAIHCCGSFQIEISSNYIANNNRGIDCHNATKANITENLIRGNHWAILGYDSSHLLIARNIIEHNTEGGIYCGEYWDDSFELVIGGSLINANQMIDNTWRSVWNRTGKDINATYNYWGTTDESEITAMLHNTGEGSIIFKPFINTLDEIIADTSGDGRVSAYDAALILQYVVGLIDQFPATNPIGQAAQKYISGEITIAELDRILQSFGYPSAFKMLGYENKLLQNYPNPFNPETWIPFKLAQDAPVIISIYDIQGQLIRTIALGTKQAGIYTTEDKAVYWNGIDRLGEKVSSGVYYYTLQAGEFRATRKMVILK